jgi:type I restriction enzyme S subunit
MNELPYGWMRVAIGDINFYDSKNINPKSKPKDFFELYSVPIFPTKNPETALGADIGSTKQKVEPNDVLLCKINPRINRVWQVQAKGSLEQIASSEWIVVRQPFMNSNFLRYQFCEESFREKLCSEVSGVGGSLTRAQPKKVATYEILIPPLAEQAYIAQKLDEMLEHVETLKARIHAIPALLKRLRQSVLAAAVSGRLTENWREAQQRILNESKACNTLINSESNGSLPINWIDSLLGKHIRVQNGKSFPSSAYQATGIRLVRPGNLNVSGKVT